jgi:hypothetical protein
MQHVLEAWSHTVLTAASLDEAIGHARAHPAIDLRAAGSSTRRLRCIKSPARTAFKIGTDTGETSWRIPTSSCRRSGCPCRSCNACNGIRPWRGSNRWSSSTDRE